MFVKQAQLGLTVLTVLAFSKQLQHDINMTLKQAHSKLTDQYQVQFYAT
ncbi:MAG: hypothetical protein RMY36_011965 [Nostoc sp. SerVER01]|nr:hypothetical protein [Nostoc sp. SerVER01]MDZ8072739.1 hypothetical protein [Nostoc sp. DedQUE01]MDZ8079694.1 hypothetical protein [Nostoc sp. DcaGUA01]